MFGYRLWDTGSGEMIHELFGQYTPVTCLAADLRYC